MWRMNGFFQKLSSFAVYMFIIAFTIGSLGTAILAIKWVLSLLGVI